MLVTCDKCERITPISDPNLIEATLDDAVVKMPMPCCGEETMITPKSMQNMSDRKLLRLIASKREAASGGRIISARLAPRLPGLGRVG